MSRNFYPPGASEFQYTGGVVGVGCSAVVAGGGGADSGGSGGGGGMDCLRLRSPPAHFHYLITEQAKSLVALQELQNEVGALLEFRDLVIETFPNLRSKMSAPSSVRRNSEWEAGVRVRRKPPTVGSEKPTKAQPSVQDSGFSTETSSSKEAHSSTRAAPLAAADELWLLLDAAHRRATELCEPDADQSRRTRSLSSSSDSSPASPTPRDDFSRVLDAVTVEEARDLRRERDSLLDKLAELETEALAGRTQASRAQADARDLEERLQDALEQRDRLDERLRECLICPTPPAAFSPVNPALPTTPNLNERLGILDNVLSTPVRTLRVRTPDTKKITAILKEENPVELQRQLLSYTVYNQMLLDKLQRVNRSKEELLDRLEKIREENDDLKFQLDEKRVELDGTKGRLKLFEESECETRERSSCNIIRRPREERGDCGAHNSMRALGPLPDHLQMQDDRLKSESDRITDTPKKNRSSRIPLLGTKTLAPKPPTGRSSGPRADRGEPASYRSRSGDSLVRPSSAQSYRNNGSLGGKTKDSITSARSPSGNRNIGSSVAKTSSKDSLTKNREMIRSTGDSLTGKVKNNDSLSRLRDSPLNDSNYSSKARKELTSSFAAVDVKKTPMAPARRASSAVARGALTDSKEETKVRPKPFWINMFRFNGP